MQKKNGKPYTKEEVRQIIITELPKLIKRDIKLREFISRLFEEKFADKKKTEDRFEQLLKEIQQQRLESEKKWEENNKRWEEQKKLWDEQNKKWWENQKRLDAMQAEWNKKWEENNKRWEENNKKWEENNKRWEEQKKLWDEQNKKWWENQKKIDAILEEIKLLHRKHDTSIGALGARWGFRAESSFRDAIKGILEESFPVQVQRYKAKDEEGIVFGKPDQIELDLIIKNGEVIVAEIKSSISKGDVATFLRKIDFYEQKEGISVKRKIMISPMFDYGAREFALSSGIEAYGYPEEVDFKDLQKD
ncbi:hypothetical protein THER_0982 [Thermodesulfovibrio sp. N1]|uniref:PD-(D/E)XK nuclease family protein n=1 Tax=Thermodesulfovibrio sp. N1 TaxID=1871110 RepID=UPI00083B9CD7|nr:DUF3782 domain-containing protein [Thermodesulfovibrio sp. N1]ODA44284.1 hypothetical protein THER_0982 [Thermodesulfovibrio sp. N1]